MPGRQFVSVGVEYWTRMAVSFEDNITRNVS
jgi:hypothetical protein